MGSASQQLSSWTAAEVLCHINKAYLLIYNTRGDILLLYTVLWHYERDLLYLLGLCFCKSVSYFLPLVLSDWKRFCSVQKAAALIAAWLLLQATNFIIVLNSLYDKKGLEIKEENVLLW